MLLRASSAVIYGRGGANLTSGSLVDSLRLHRHPTALLRRASWLGPAPSMRRNVRVRCAASEKPAFWAAARCLLQSEPKDRRGAPTNSRRSSCSGRILNVASLVAYQRVATENLYSTTPGR